MNADLFDSFQDMIAATSTGGIISISAAVVTPGARA
jgi:hypothetical protein